MAAVSVKRSIINPVTQKALRVERVFFVRPAVHKQSFLKILTQNGPRVTKVYGKRFNNGEQRCCSGTENFRITICTVIWLQRGFEKGKNVYYWSWHSTC